METGNNGNKTVERKIGTDVKVFETEYHVQRPIFEDVIIERPFYIEKQIDIPVGYEKIVLSVCDEIVDKILKRIDEKLENAITNRIKEVELPKITYKEEIHVIEADRVVLKDVEVLNPKLVDKEIINPILRNVEVQNAILKDVEVERPIFKERIVIQPKFVDIEIDKPVYVKKEIIVIDPKYIDMKGNPE